VIASLNRLSNLTAMGSFMGRRKTSQGNSSKHPLPDIDSLIVTVRGQKVLLDSALARVYGVPTFRFNEAVKRNQHRFPPDFRFQLTAEEWAALQHLRSQTAILNATDSNSSQIAMSSARHRGAAYRPYAFTEHGAMMAANILNSARAIEMSVYVIRAFVKMRAVLAKDLGLARRLAEIEKSLIGHDTALRDLYDKIRPLLLPAPEPKRREIGFHTRPDAEAPAQSDPGSRMSAREMRVWNGGKTARPSFRVPSSQGKHGAKKTPHLASH
jgi:hypothetical protein